MTSCVQRWCEASQLVLDGARNVSGKGVVKILCNKFGFEVTGRKGGHIRLSKITTTVKVGTVVPMH